MEPAVFVARWHYRGQSLPNPALVELASELCAARYRVPLELLSIRTGESLESAAARFIQVMFEASVEPRADEDFDTTGFVFHVEQVELTGQ